MNDNKLVTLKEVKEARNKISDICVHTPLMYSDLLSKECGNEVYLKPENLQHTGAFKLRGAANKIMRLTDEEKAKGLIASSAGNHAQGVAFSAQRLGLKCTIVMPKSAPLIKVKATRAYGATVILHGSCYDEAYEEAKRLEKEHGYTFVHPFDDIDVIAGQGTIALEILEDLNDTDIILVPLGGGGLISGIATAAKAINPNIKVIGVESEGAKAGKLSVDSGRIQILEKVDTIADGAAVKKVGDKTFEIIKELVDDIIVVEDYELMEGVFLLLEKHKIVAEATGALSVAALKKLDVKGKKVVSVISGGNIDVVTMSTLLNNGLVSRGRLFCFTVNLLDAPGELVKISTIIAEQKANVVKLEHNLFKAVDRLKTVELEATLETNGHEHIEEILQALANKGYIAKRIY